MTVGNALLASRPESYSETFRKSLVLFKGGSDQMLWEQGEEVRHVLFPIDGVISLTKTEMDKNWAVLALIGNEGLAGAECLLGNPAALSTARIVSPGSFLRIKPEIVQSELTQNIFFQKRILRFFYAHMAQFSQNVLCKRHHELQSQLVRLLLVYADRLTASDLVLTHEQIAYFLGARRESISVIAHKLQEQGAIRYSRGKIKLVDRDALEGLACACYSQCRSEFQGLRGYLKENSVF